MSDFDRETRHEEFLNEYRKLFVSEFGLLEWSPIYLESSSFFEVFEERDLFQPAIEIALSAIEHKDCSDQVKSNLAEIFQYDPHRFAKEDRAFYKKTIQSYWPRIRALYEAQPDQEYWLKNDTELRESQTKKALAHALFKCVDMKLMPELLQMIKEPRNGPSRWYLMIALSKRKAQPWVRDFYHELVVNEEWMQGLDIEDVKWALLPQR